MKLNSGKLTLVTREHILLETKRMVGIYLLDVTYLKFSFCHQRSLSGRHRGEGGAGGALGIKLLFQFFSKVLHKKLHRVILCQTCGPLRKYCFFLIAPFRSNIAFWRFSWCLSRQFAEFLVRSRRLGFRLPNNEFQAPVCIFASPWNGVSRRL